MNNMATIQGGILNVSDENFEAEVLQTTLPTIVDFWAEWCPPCHALAPLYEQLSAEYAGKVNFVKLNIDEQPRTPTQLRILAAPTLVFFHEGREIGRIVGPHPRRLKTQIEQVFAHNGIAL